MANLIMLCIKKNHPFGFRWLHESFGTNWRMTEIQATIGRMQLQKMSQWTRKRNQNQNLIWKTCQTLDLIRTPKFNEKSWEFYDEGNVHAAYKCYVFINKSKLKSGWSRDKIIKEINNLGVPCFLVHVPKYIEKKPFINPIFDQKNA